MKTIIRFLLIASMGCMASAMADEVPAVTLAILNPLAGEPVPAGVTPVSNIKRIEVMLTFDKKGKDGLPALAQVPLNPAQAENPDQFITIKVADFTSGTVIPVKVFPYEKTANDGKEVVNFSMEILEKAGAREGKIQAFVDGVRTQQATVPGAESKDLVHRLAVKNDEAVAALKTIYSENRVGKFKVVAEYHSSNSTAWVGSTSSQELVVEVKRKGAFLDSLKKPAGK
jgi:hypothetical protein